MKIITEVRLVNGCNPGEVYLQVTGRELFFDDAGLLVKQGPEFTETQLLYPQSYSWQVANAT